jgi:predicted ATPase
MLCLCACAMAKLRYAGKFPRKAVGLVGALRDRRLVPVLDNCEHVIEAAATLAVAILRGAADVHILATSREPLRVEGEHVQRLPPLSSGFPSDHLGAAEALAFPAVELFVERTAERLGEFELDPLIFDKNALLRFGLYVWISEQNASVNNLRLRGPMTSWTGAFRKSSSEV